MNNIKPIISNYISLIILLPLMTLCTCKREVIAQVSGKMKLGAYYFAGWAGKCPYDDDTPENVWAKGMPSHFTKRLATEFSGRTPIWGWRDDKQELMERQIDLASEHGISFFSFCWYWKNNKGPINIPAIESDSKHLPMYMFMNAKNNRKMEFCLLIANHNGFEITGENAWRQAADFWISHYFKHSRYLTIEGKPLIIIFSPGTVSLKGLEYLQSTAKKAGLPGVEIAYCGSTSSEKGFTLRTNYNIIPGYGKPSEAHPYSELVNAHFAGWKGTSIQPYIPVATVGWDRRPWEAPDGLGKGAEPSWYFTGNTPDSFEAFLRKMAEWIDKNPDQVTKDKLALIYAWNEIGEGGWLVPCKDDPDGAYLKAIRNVIYKK